MKASGYSLWLIPDTQSEEYLALEQCINVIAARYGTPTFAPHVTLLGGMEGSEQEMLGKAEVLSKRLSPYAIRLGELGSSGIYFQILFLKVEEDAPVMRANALAKEVFGVNSGNYFPHTSLAYGEFTGAEIGVLKGLVSQMCPVVGMRFLVHEIELWRSLGVVAEWYKVATYPMGT